MKVGPLVGLLKILMNAKRRLNGLQLFSITFIFGKKIIIMNNPSRPLVRLKCGHGRRVVDPYRHTDFYCLRCDDYFKVDKILPIYQDIKKMEVDF